MVRANLITCALLFSFVAAASAQPRAEYRAYWVDTFNTTLNNHADVQAVVDKAIASHANAIFAQVRRRGDAWYLNSLEPPPDFIPIEAGFDPLQDLIDTAHAAGVEVHAFVIMSAIWNKNPTFLPTSTLGPPLNPNHVFNLHGGYDPVTKTIVPGPDNWLTRSLVSGTFQGHRFGNDFHLDFGHPDAAAYTADVLRYLVNNYDIDGLHLDRIRYPDFSVSGQTPTTGTSIGYNVRSIARFDWVQGRPPGSPAPARNDPSWNQWRRDQVSNLVRRVYLETMATKPWVKVSAALIVFGGAPSTWGGAEAYWRVYQDWDAWLQEGVLDVAIPMNYKREHVATQVPMLDTWNEWIKDHQYNRASMIGLGNYLNGIEGSLRQVRRSLGPSAAGNSSIGVALYSMAGTNQSIPFPPSDLTPSNPFAIPPGPTGLRLFPDFAAGLTTGRSADGAVLFETIAPSIFADPATVPVLPWKANPQVGHVKGVIRDATGAVVDTGAVAIVRVDGAETAPGRRSATTATDGNGFYGGVDLAVGRYQVSITPVREAPYVYRCATVNVLPGQVSTFDIDLPVDRDDPVVTLAVTPDSLWPPDGTLHTITATVSATDASSLSLRLAVEDEYGRVAVAPMTTSGVGPISWTPAFQLESARDGGDRDGRVYTITLTATDEACNLATTTAAVTVPHDQRDKD